MCLVDEDSYEGVIGCIEKVCSGWGISLELSGICISFKLVDCNDSTEHVSHNYKVVNGLKF